ncbi:hypothetical protein G7K_1842-t1 [Saitoella complicata NRRL Y-17804]|uniref:Uncharacterized protein n=1 Tax=Saitoella complicata (strain BCRC 22490 / CBS 7301 / JCM 7358 / NBRC 10748 / NRRL Y-17804) TaxID=698492 RepID=A0A0E9NCQ0_SAICN|nr:hypothetical protein G7K_1842-t1 [Saitoella complicata NRRL Y-17804]
MRSTRRHGQDGVRYECFRLSWGYMCVCVSRLGWSRSHNFAKINRLVQKLSIAIITKTIRRQISIANPQKALNGCCNDSS